MRIFSTKTHGVIDYLMGIILIISPWVLGFNQGGPETIIPVVIGAAIILMSLFTDYELGLVRSIPMPTHLLLDVLAGIFLALTPWLFDFNEIVMAPHLIFGIALLGSGIFTSTVPEGCRTC